MNVLLVGINYEPEKTGIGPYTTGMADHLRMQGHGVTVVTGMPHYPQWKTSPSYRGKVKTRERVRGIEVHRLRQYTPSQQSALGRALYELSFFLLATSLVNKVNRPDCVIGVVPSLSGGAAAATMARRYRVPLGLVFQDLVGQAAAESGIPGGGLVARPARAIEAYTARQAAKVAVVAEAFRPYLVALGVEPAHIMHLPNWSQVTMPTRPATEVRRSFGWATDRPIVLHAGNIGYKQDLENVVRAARYAENNGSDLLFVLMGDGTDRKRLERVSADLSNFVFLDPQPEETFMDVLGAADVLLLNERSTVLTMSLPSKVTSYFWAGRPVVGAVPQGGPTSQELAKSGGAIVVDPGNPMALLSAIELALTDPDRSGLLVARAKTYAKVNFDRTTVLRLLDTFVSSLTMYEQVNHRTEGT